MRLLVKLWPPEMRFSMRDAENPSVHVLLLLWLSHGSQKKRSMAVLFSLLKRGPKKTQCFLGPLKNAGRDSGIFDAILVGFALPFVEISMDVAAK